MRTETIEVRVGENMGPVDWTHPTAANKSQVWRDAEASPDSHLFNGRAVLAVCMYDGWPYWSPRPAVQFIGPMNSPEWAFFDSYGTSADSMTRKIVAVSK
jgi:hypothetical protein